MLFMAGQAWFVHLPDARARAAEKPGYLASLLLLLLPQHGDDRITQLIEEPCRALSALAVRRFLCRRAPLANLLANSAFRRYFEHARCGLF